MITLLKGGKIYTKNGFADADILIKDGVISEVEMHNTDLLIRENDSSMSPRTTIDCSGCCIIPGLIDVHVHFREPGFEYKETIATGSAAAAAGGYTTVCTMPNLDPAPWDMKGLEKQLEIIRKDALVRLIPYGRITRPAGSAETVSRPAGSAETVSRPAVETEECVFNEKGKAKNDLVIDGRKVADLEDMAPYVFAFSDDGTGVQQDELMEEAMLRAKALGKIIVAHCEDTRYAPEDPRSEYKQIERDIRLVEKTGCAYHVCHISAKESIDLIRQAKARGLDVTCETAPHYLVFYRSDLEIKDEEQNEVQKKAKETAQKVRGNTISENDRESNDICARIAELGEDEGGRFKMNPPIRGKEDRRALLEAIADGTIDMIATDHAPHSEEEKAKGFTGSLNGILGLETAFPVMYSSLVETGIITLERLVELMSIAPARRFGLNSDRTEKSGRIEESNATEKSRRIEESNATEKSNAITKGARADLTVIDINDDFVIDPEKFLSKGRSTPFSGMAVRGKIKYTVSDGTIVFRAEN